MSYLRVLYVSFNEYRGGTFTGASDIRYRWTTKKGHLQVRYLCLPTPVISIFTTLTQLVREDDEEQKSLAEFHPHRRHFFVFRMSKHARLEVKPQPEVTEALERLIGESFKTVCGNPGLLIVVLNTVSYLLIERRRRDSRLRVKLEKS